MPPPLPFKIIRRTPGPTQPSVNPPIRPSELQRIEKRAQARLERQRNYSSPDHISDTELEAILQNKLGDLWMPGADRTLFLGDLKYYCAPLDELQRMTRRSRDTLHAYAPEIFDCDDFAVALKGHFVREAFINGRDKPFAFAVGIVWVYRPVPHALNWAISWSNSERNKRTLYLIEPQTAEIYDIDDQGKMQKVFDLPPKAKRGALIDIVPKTEPYGDFYFLMI